MPKILIVEDEQGFRDLLRERLAMWGYEVVAAGDEDGACAKAAAHIPDLILMDISLNDAGTGEEGHEATRRIKSQPETSAIPVIALSAHNELVYREQARAAGCDDYEIKPVDFQRLKKKIETLLGRRTTAP